MNGNKRTRQILRITFRQAENGKTEQEVIDELVNQIVGKILARYQIP